jgi:biotin carboxylase
MSNRPAIALLAGASSYRLAAFMRAASRLDLDVIRVIDTPGAPVSRSPQDLYVDFAFPSEAIRRLLILAKLRPDMTVLAVDDVATEIAGALNFKLCRSHNLSGSEIASRDKAVMRSRFEAAGLPTPARRLFPLDLAPDRIDPRLPFPVVIKPTRLSGSRGVLRVDSLAELGTAYDRVRSMLIDDGFSPSEEAILVEQFIPGREVAVEGLLTDGSLTVLTIFDKPDPLDGPLFEETIYVTPSRLPDGTQEAIAGTTARMAEAVGLRHGPVHAELRIDGETIWPIEVAGRTIGGMCSTILEFGAGMPLEEIILRHAVGMKIPSLERMNGAAGVMMIPIPGAGMLRTVEGIEAAKSIPGVTGVEITAPVNQPIQPLPEGASYLGFIFARGEDPAEVESTLREAHRRLDIQIAPMLKLAPVR